MAWRLLLQSEEWEHGGISITGSPKVTLTDLVSVAPGVRRPDALPVNG